MKRVPDFVPFIRTGTLIGLETGCCTKLQIADSSTAHFLERIIVEPSRSFNLWHHSVMSGLFSAHSAIISASPVLQGISCAWLGRSQTFSILVGDNLQNKALQLGHQAERQRRDRDRLRLLREERERTHRRHDEPEELWLQVQFAKNRAQE